VLSQVAFALEELRSAFLIREDGSIEGGDGLLSRLVVAVDGGHAWCSSQLSGEQRYEDVPTKLNDATAAGLELV
jgi:hypothetical protein